MSAATHAPAYVQACIHQLDRRAAALRLRRDDVSLRRAAEMTAIADELALLSAHQVRALAEQLLAEPPAFILGDAR